MLTKNWVLATVIGYFSISLLAYHYDKKQKLKHKKKKENEQKLANDYSFKLPTSESYEWKFYAGKEFTDEKYFSGHGIGRQIWIPPKDDIIDKENFLKNCSIPAQQAAFNAEKNPNSGDKLYRAQALNEAKSSSSINIEKVNEKSIKGALFYSKLQNIQGFWPADYGGPMFLMPGLIIACYVTKVDLGEGRRVAMLNYILNHQQEDGGWGMHIEGSSTMFGSVLNYVAARLLGLKSTSSEALKAQKFIREENDGVTSCAQWGKTWLAILGVYKWEGVNPMPPELWLLPYWFPLHPGKMWCHCRMVYLPMSVLFGKRWVYEDAEKDEIILSLRSEIYKKNEDYKTLKFSSITVREKISFLDEYNPQTYLMTFVNHILHNTIENEMIRALFYFPLNWLRKKSIHFASDYVDAEDIHTNFVDIGPVSKAFHVVVNYVIHGENSVEFKKQATRIVDYLWLAEDGMKMHGYNGSQFWDCCFATRAIATVVKNQINKQSQKTAKKETASSLEVKQNLMNTLEKSWNYIEASQVREDVYKRFDFFRDKSMGGWPFSTRDHGWPISDCTAEGIKTVITLEKLFKRQLLPPKRFEEAVEILLGLQNLHTNGGWASYEQQRGGEWYEIFNPAQVFGDIMVDYSYVECSSACVQALTAFSHHFPESKLVSKAMRAASIGVDFILAKQRKNGSWYGSWGVCFTYAAWFGVEGLVTGAKSTSDVNRKAKIIAALQKACEFLMEMQSADGGWSESVEACAVKDWVTHSDGSQVVNTAWATLALCSAANIHPDAKYVKSALRGVEYLKMKQEECGDWPQEGISGVFNKSCGITYTAYRNAFPIWALAAATELPTENLI